MLGIHPMKLRLTRWMAWFVVVAAFGCGDADPAPADDGTDSRDYATGDALADDPQVTKSDDPKSPSDGDSDPSPTDSTDDAPSDEESDAVVLPPIPHELDELPEGVQAPWPGDVVHGALLEVSHVIDGDTLKLALEDRDVPLRIQGINAPECDKRPAGNHRECNPDAQDLSGDAEPHGVRAWEALREAVLDREVRIACREVNGRCETDRYGRFLGFVVLDDQDVGETLAAQGHVWPYTQFPPDNIYTYCVAEEAAIDTRAGMWTAGFDSVIVGMNPSTRNWYAYRDSTCEEYAP